ncbi:hypothetical protein X772_07575 [Mesorhizobium sp. LSJC280B00]|nr:hypothetical protein X772_07575 [Mesorhizobium sp. LSJC280B00]
MAVLLVSLRLSRAGASTWPKSHAWFYSHGRWRI